MMQAAELSLRSGVYAAKAKLLAGENIGEKIKDEALKQFEKVSKIDKSDIEDSLSSLKNSQSMQTAAIGIAVQGLELAYSTIQSQLKDAKAERRRFVEECETHVARMVISSKKEHHEFSNEENAIRSFYKIIQKNCTHFIDYFGIHIIQDPDDKDIQIYTVLPYFRMSQALPQNSAVTSELDQIRQGIYLFLKTGLPLERYYQEYQNNSRLWMQIIALWTRDNYLNNYRTPRFIIIAIANLLWSLQHPVDTQYGSPMSLNQSVDICTKAAMFLNDVLAEDNFPYLYALDDHLNSLRFTIAMSELYIICLHNAFDIERLREINLNEVSNHMHKALKIMSNKLLELVYQDENATEHLVSQFMNLSTLLLHNPMLYTYFHSLQVQESPLYVNERARTVVDVLILFAHMSPYQRKQFYQKIAYEKSDVNAHLIYLLKQFSRSFLIPFETTAIQKLALNQFDTKTIYQETAKHFIPLIFLIMESYNVYHDTRPKKKSTLDIQDASPTYTLLFDLKHTWDDVTQRESILKDAGVSVQGEELYYKLSITIFFHTKHKNYENMNQLLLWQNDMRQKTNFLDELTRAIQENRKVLQFQLFQDQVLQCLAEIHNSYRTLNENINSVEAQILFDNNIHRNEKRILQPMLSNLESTLELIQKSITQVSNILSSPGFTEQEQQKMIDKAKSLINRFQQSFPDMDASRFEQANPYGKITSPFRATHHPTSHKKEKILNFSTGNPYADMAIKGTITIINPMTYLNLASNMLTAVTEAATDKTEKDQTPDYPKPARINFRATNIRQDSFMNPSQEPSRLLALRENLDKRIKTPRNKKTIKPLEHKIEPTAVVKLNFDGFLLNVIYINLAILSLGLLANLYVQMIGMYWGLNLAFFCLSTGLGCGLYLWQTSKEVSNQFTRI